MRGTIDTPRGKRPLRLPLSLFLVILTASLLLFLRGGPADCREDADYTMVIEFEAAAPEGSGASVDAPRYSIPIHVSGTNASGEATWEEQSGHQVTVLTFEGTLEDDVLRGDISYELTGSTAGYESTWTYTFYAPDIELSVAEGTATHQLVETTMKIEESGEGGSDSYTEEARFYVWAYPGGGGGSGTGTTEGGTGEQAGGQETEGGTSLRPGGIRDVGGIPGPASWPQAAAGLLLPGFLGLIVSLLSSLYGGAPAPPPAPAQAPPPPATQLDDLTLEARRFIEVQRKHTQYWSDHAYREIVDRMESECFGPDGRVDWERYCDFRFGEVDAMKRAYVARDDPLLLNAKELAKAAGRSLWDAGVALKDGVVGFAEGLMAVPGTVYQGWKELGGLFLDEYRESVKDFWDPGRYRWSLAHDVLSPDVAVQTGRNLYHAVGEELLPVNEIKCFFAGDATLEEKLWALPSGVVKTVNLIMLSPQIARLPVPGISRDATLVRSARPVSRAVEAAKASSLSAEAQAEYEAYKAEAAERAARIQEAVEQGGRLSAEQVLDAMSDPATMRVLKEAPQVVKSKFFTTQAREVYSPVYRDVIEYMEERNPGVEYRVKSVRTPGRNDLINTDNDVILQRKVTTADGQAYWEEVPVKEWEGPYHESFSRHSGFSPEKAKATFPEENWDAMSPEQQQKVWTEKFGQETMDVKQPEAAHAFSDQPTAMDPQWRPGGKSPVAEGRAVDQPGLGMMEYYKATKGYRGGTVQAQTEAMEQGIKACRLGRRLAAHSQARTGYRYAFPKVFDQGLEVLNRRELAPTVRDLALKDLGLKGGYEDFMYKLSNWMGGLR